MPAVGWRTVVTTETSLTFLAQGAATWWIVTVAADPAGGWQASEYGECHLAARLEKSLAYAEWRLDPKHPPKPGGRTVTLLATEQACASGRPPGSRLLAPLVEETDAAVTVTLLVRRRGNADCQANPEFPVIVSLGKALGTRSLLDGSSVPPARRG